MLARNGSGGVHQTAVLRLELGPRGEQACRRRGGRQRQGCGANAWADSLRHGRLRRLLVAAVSKHRYGRETRGWDEEAAKHFEQTNEMHV